MCSEWTFWHILAPCSYKTCQGDKTGSQCITLVTWWQNMPWWQNEPQQGPPCAVRFKLVKLCCSSYSELQQGQPPCSLPISCETKSTLKHIASYKRLGNCYDPCWKPSTEQTVHWIMITGATWPPWGWWLSEALVGGRVSGCIPCFPISGRNNWVISYLCP